MSEETTNLTIVDGGFSKGTYAVVARTNKYYLSVRPILSLRNAINRSGKPVDGMGIVLAFRVHLSDLQFKSMPAKRTAKAWGRMIQPRHEKNYYRNFVYLQIARKDGCTKRYLNQKIAEGTEVVVGALLDDIAVTVTPAELTDVVHWVQDRLSNEVDHLSETGAKNVPGLVNKLFWEFDNQDEG